MICGESGSGKSTIIRHLCEMYNLKELESYTTRPKRIAFEAGHVFISKNEFDSLLEKVAYAAFDEFEYCATRNQVDNSDVLTIDPKGIEYFQKNYHGNKRYYIIYIQVDEEERRRRMIFRGDNKVNVERRLSHERIFFKDFQKEADLVVNNFDINKCLLEIWQFISEINKGEEVAL